MTDSCVFGLTAGFLVAAAAAAAGNGFLTGLGALDFTDPFVEPDPSECKDELVRCSGAWELRIGFFAFILADGPSDKRASVGNGLTFALVADPLVELDPTEDREETLLFSITPLVDFVELDPSDEHEETLFFSITPLVDFVELDPTEERDETLDLSITPLLGFAELDPAEEREETLDLSIGASEEFFLVGSCTPIGLFAFADGCAAVVGVRDLRVGLVAATAAGRGEEFVLWEGSRDRDALAGPFMDGSVDN